MDSPASSRASSRASDLTGLSASPRGRSLEGASAEQEASEKSQLRVFFKWADKDSSKCHPSPTFQQLVFLCNGWLALTVRSTMPNLRLIRPRRYLSFEQFDHLEMSCGRFIDEDEWPSLCQTYGRQPDVGINERDFMELYPIRVRQHNFDNGVLSTPDEIINAMRADCAVLGLPPPAGM